jgi:hypothetical protein
MKNRRASRSAVTSALLACVVSFWSTTTLAQVKLEHKFPEGTKLTYKTRSKTRQVLTSMGTENVTEEDTTTITSRLIGKRRGDSSLPVLEQVESLRAAFSFPGGINVNFNSSDHNFKVNDPELAFLGDELKFISESAYTVVLDAKNKVKAIEGAERSLQNAEKFAPNSREFLKGQFDSEKVKLKFEQALQILPESPAVTGTPWERTEVHDIAGQTLTFRKKYEYAGTEKRKDKTLDKIASKVMDITYKANPDTKSLLKVKKANLKVDSSDGMVLFDREAGRVVSSKDRTHVKGDMTFSVNSADFTNTLDLRTETDTELQSVGK